MHKDTRVLPFRMAADGAGPRQEFLSNADGELPEFAVGNPLYDRKALGRLEHALVATLAARFPVDDETVDQTVEALVRASVQAPVHRIGLRARLRSTWWRYADAFPPSSGSRFLGSEVAVPGGRLDLLWRSPSGLLFADENKTGALLYPLDRPAVGQARRQLQGALVTYGAEFAGIRILSFAAPWESLFLDAVGVLTPLNEGSVR